jgi:hypothetical protein
LIDGTYDADSFDRTTGTGLEALVRAYEAVRGS